MNLVLTCLLTTLPDPQRGVRFPADASMLDGLLKSVVDSPVAVIHDELDEPDRDTVTFHRITPDVQVYFQRWLAYADHLARSDAERVWCVDGTDVEMLRPPWDDMQPGVLYLGSEPGPVANRWLYELHPSARRFVADHQQHTLMNAGLVGGDRATVADFLDDLASRFDVALEAGDQTDMGVFNMTAWSRRWAARTVTGEIVHTQFRANEQTNRFAWWRHK